MLAELSSVASREELMVKVDKSWQSKPASGTLLSKLLVPGHDGVLAVVRVGQQELKVFLVQAISGAHLAS